MQTEKEYFAGREVAALRCESVGEYSLPDYNGDVKRVLLVRSKVFPSGKFASDDALEISGTVGYDVVYVDAENTVTHAEFSTDYDARMRINPETYVDSDVLTRVSSCNVRLIGPRKLSVKTILDSDVCVSERRVERIEGDAFMEYEPEYVSVTADVLSVQFASSDAKELSEEIISLDGAIADEVEILTCDTDARVEIVDMTSSSVALKGGVEIRMLYRGADGVLLEALKNIPYNEDVYMDGASDFSDASARLEVSALGCSVFPTDDGVRLCASVSVLPRVCARKNAFLNLVSDAFLKERGTVNEYVDFPYTEHVTSVCEEEKWELEEPLSELDLDNVSEIVCSNASVRVDEKEMCDNYVKIRGEIRFSAIACQVSEDGSTSYVPVKFSAPFEKNVNINCQICGNMHINCHVDVRDVLMESATSNINVTASVVACINVTADKRVRCMGASYVTDEEFEKDDSVVTVYYPDAGESLFEIAKRFHTSTYAIAETNRLSESVFSSASASLGAMGVGKLIIK